MSFSYEKIKRKSPQSSFWTTYADLATVLSALFLLLYMVANIRMSSFSISEKISKELAEQKIKSLEEQLQTYEVLKEKYLNSGASEKELKMYSELMNQMSLLESIAKDEKEKLLVQAKDSEEKEKALNRYQRIIKNIINTNMLVQKELKSRDDIIKNQTLDIEKLKKDIINKEKLISENEQKIEKIKNTLKNSIEKLKKAKKEKRITKETLLAKINHLKTESQKKISNLLVENSELQEELETTQKMIEEKTKEASIIEKEKMEALNELNKEKKTYSDNIGKLNLQIGELKKALQQKEEEFLASIEKIKAQNLILKEDKEKTMKKLAEREAFFEASINKLRSEYDSKALENQKNFDENLKKANLSAEEKLAKERSHRAKLEKEKELFASKLKLIGEELSKTKKEISEKENEYADELRAQKSKFEEALSVLKKEHEKNIEKEKAAFEESLKKERMSAADIFKKQKEYADKLASEKANYNSKVKILSDELEKTKGAIKEQEHKFNEATKKLVNSKKELERELASLKSREEEKAQLAKKLNDNFRKTGLNAQVNMKSGEVVINFGNEYFDTGKAELKPGMIKILEKALPVYAVSLMEDKKISEKIASVEIIGFASPTYKGKYVNPKELSSKTRKAVDYNMDLSYQRAKSIFDYVFDPKKMVFNYQKELLSLTKVSGQGYLRESVLDRGVQLSGQEFCARYDCTKSQKVVIKFYFKE